jgi:FtsX-like permease family protein
VAIALITAHDAGAMQALTVLIPEDRRYRERRPHFSRRIPGGEWIIRHAPAADFLALHFFYYSQTPYSCFGLYGVIAHFVAQRTREIGIRLALGAQRGNVMRAVLRRGMGLTLIGVGIGLMAAAALTPLMKSLLYGVSPIDPMTFGGLAMLVMVAALLACYLPARSAMKVDPIVALRSE